ncbi:MAG: trehalose-6-phosphate synthase, partial [Rhodospirillaceae bacterium]|nr:trehalose-6-phosphate synthase [Rhodospirillaceae bacterium]
MANRIVVVSNRVAPVNEGKAAAGGLAVAVLAALRRSGGVWFGWSGEVVAVPDETVKLTESGRLARATVALGERDYEEYYNRFANATLWPLFHYRVDLVNFERGNYTGYRRVNRQFARSLAGLLRPDDLIWVHDYHLIPLGQELRRLGVRNRLGLFLHTPLPPRELLATLPVHKELMRCFSFFDLVGFQTETDRSHLLDWLVREAKARVEHREGDAVVRAFRRVFRV